MLRNLLHRANSRARFLLPGPVAAVAYMLYRARGSYLQDGLLTAHNSDFRSDPKFRDAYRLGKATGPWDR